MASRGQILGEAAYPVVDRPVWRAIFDLSFDAATAPPDDTPIDLRAFVSHGDQAVTETLLLQLFPTQLRAALARKP